MKKNGRKYQKYILLLFCFFLCVIGVGKHASLFLQMICLLGKEKVENQ